MNKEPRFDLGCILDIPPCWVRNDAPESDQITITIARVEIFITRDESGEVAVEVSDTEEGSSARYILGQEGYTHKL